MLSIKAAWDTMNRELTEDNKEMPLYPISIVAEIVGTTDQTLRLYEKHGLLKPSRRKNNRYYSKNDIEWIRCLRDLIHKKKISIEGIKKLLEYAPCWEITDCPVEVRESCTAFVENTKHCWELNDMICKKNGESNCKVCVVYLNRKHKIKKNSNQK